MRTTGLTNNQCAELFAGNAVSRGQTSNENLFFESHVLYSYGYHFPLAVIRGDNKAFLNTVSYSVSTRQHQSLAHSELEQAGYEVIEVESTALMKDLRDLGVIAPSDLSGLVSRTNEQIEESKLKAERARKEWSIQYHQRRAKELKENLDKLLKAVTS